jgi:hypothetical protein
VKAAHVAISDADVQQAIRAEQELPTQMLRLAERLTLEEDVAAAGVGPFLAVS